MSKKDLINSVQADCAPQLTKKQVGEIIDALFDKIGGAIKDEGRFAYPGIGVWTVKESAARTGRNPRTGDAIDIPASKTLRFKAAPELKKAVN